MDKNNHIDTFFISLYKIATMEGGNNSGHENVLSFEEHCQIVEFLIACVNNIVNSHFNRKLILLENNWAKLSVFQSGVVFYR